MNYMQTYISPLGPMTMASDGDALTGLWFAGQKHFAATLTEPYLCQSLLVFAKTQRWLEHYFEGEQTKELPPIGLKGSAFCLAVWEIVQTIPYGQTMTYGEIAAVLAKRLGREKVSARAVGGAVARNPLAVIVPCHRVVGSNGSLTGYAGGMERKIALLRLEGADMSRLFAP